MALLHCVMWCMYLPRWSWPWGAQSVPCDDNVVWWMVQEWRQCGYNGHQVHPQPFISCTCSSPPPARKQLQTCHWGLTMLYTILREGAHKLLAFWHFHTQCLQLTLRCVISWRSVFESWKPPVMRKKLFVQAPTGPEEASCTFIV